MTRLVYLLVTAALSAGLALVAVFGEGLVRSHGADVLVVIWLYFLLRTLTMGPKQILVLLTLIIAFAVELGQVIDLAGMMGLGESRGARLALGSTFDPLDFLAYITGGILAFALDRAPAKD